MVCSVGHRQDFNAVSPSEPLPNSLTLTSGLFVFKYKLIFYNFIKCRQIAKYLSTNDSNVCLTASDNKLEIFALNIDNCNEETFCVHPK